MKRVLGMLIVLAFAATPALAQKITIDYAHDFDFEKVKTFQYVETEDSNMKDELMHGRARDAIIRELTEGGHQLPEAYLPQRYSSRFHGVGLCDEWPGIKYPADFEDRGYDGVLEPGMMLCVEAYVGEVGGPDGIKLEDQLLVTEAGVENLTRLSFDEKLLG